MSEWTTAGEKKEKNREFWQRMKSDSEPGGERRHANAGFHKRELGLSFEVGAQSLI